MILRLFLYHNMIAYGIALGVFFCPDIAIDIYNYLALYGDAIPTFGLKFALMMACVLMGNRIYQSYSPELEAPSPPPPAPQQEISKRVFGIGSILLVMVANIMLMYFVLGSHFLERDDYHSILEEHGILMLISKIGLFAGIIMIHGYSRVAIPLRWAAVFFLIGLSLNYSSFMCGGYPLALLLFDFMFLKKRHPLRICAYLAAAFLVMMCAGYFRTIPNQGILNYIRGFNSIEFLAIAGFTIYYIWPFTILVSLATMHTYTPSFSNALINLNPLPGALAGWKEIADYMIVQTAVPYSTMGMIFAFGPLFIVPFYILLGFFFGYIDRTIRNLLRKSRNLFAVIIIGLGSYYVVLHGGWQLRSSTRIIYYTLFVCILVNGYISLHEANLADLLKQRQAD